MRVWLTIGLGVWAVLGATAVQAGTLGTAGDFNAVVFGNFETSGGATGGRLAVGGDATIKFGYRVGESLSSGSHGGRDTVVVGKTLHAAMNWQVFNGNTVYGVKYKGTPATYASGSGYASRKATAADDLPSLFSTMRHEALTLSGNLRDTANNGSVRREYLGGHLIATGGDSRMNVIDVNGDDWSWAHRFTINAPKGSTVIVNVSGKNLSLSGVCSLGGASAAENFALGSRVLYNFYEAESLSLFNIDIFGSILAPKASLTMSLANVNGTAIVQNANVCGGEFRQCEFVGVPEPGSTALMLSGAAVFGLFVVRRRRRLAA